MFLATSVAVTLILSSAFKAGTGIENSPFSPAFAEAFCPFGRVTSTVEPASAVPVMAVAPALTGFTLGAFGAVTSAGFASTLISFHPTGLVYLPSLMFETTLALPG